MLEIHALQKDLSRRVQGDVLTDHFDRGLYATDASAYQIMPLAVVVPECEEDIAETLDYASQNSIPILPRGGGTSQCGQTVSEGIVVDTSKHLNRLFNIDPDNHECRAEGGIVLDELNRKLKPHNLWFPVDVSTSSRATLGGMTGNNSCGSRSIRYGLMRDNVVDIDAMLPNTETMSFSDVDIYSGDNHPLIKALLNIGNREQHEIEHRFPKVLRRVGGYNIDALTPKTKSANLSHLLVGSEGTLAYFRSIGLKLSPIPKHKLLGICHFPTFHAAMDAAQHLVTLGPIAVELIDRTMIDLSRGIPLFKGTMERMLNGEPEAVLLVEFAGEDPAENHRRLRALSEMMSDLGYSFTNPKESRGGVVEAIDPAFQNSVFEVRKAGLNIMMSMRDDRKPVSFVEDCAVELKDLAEYTSRLTNIFHKHGTEGTWYAHASVGCLHVRPVLNLRLDQDRKAMRAIAEECFDMILEYKGSHSGEHGDGICRSEFHEKMYGKRITEAFAEVKKLFDPKGLMNPGKIVNPLRMDDASLFRFPPDYSVPAMKTALDWRGWTGQGGGFQGAVEMCNNNGACRKLVGGAMCPSFRATRDERHVTRGRANVLRLAISGQLGEGALTDERMKESMQLCVSCKACRRECPTGVDMARMKIEVNAARHEAFGSDLHQRLIAHLPRYAPYASRMHGLSNLPLRSRGLRRWIEPATGMSHKRPLPRWSSTPYLNPATEGPADGKPIVLFADTFNTWFEPSNLHAARQVLAAAGFRVHSLTSPDGHRPLCCGRTYLTTGMIDEAKQEVQRLLEAVRPYLEKGMPIIGIEPSCILGLRDEIPALMGTRESEQLAAMSYLFEEFIEMENPELEFQPANGFALLHGHCHQKSFDQMRHVERSLSRIPGLEVETITSGCCGMAGAFGYAKDTYRVSEAMAELDLLPVVRKADHKAIILADGTSCRHQIALGTEREAIHVAMLMYSFLNR
ncbi:MAG: FAD-binding protein [Gammaproteobacteria bacterium]|nr:FAD-binding protein [Gammaproteobacteria bacterium]